MSKGAMAAPQPASSSSSNGGSDFHMPMGRCSALSQEHDRQQNENCINSKVSSTYDDIATLWETSQLNAEALLRKAEAALRYYSSSASTNFLPAENSESARKRRRKRRRRKTSSLSSSSYDSKSRKKRRSRKTGYYGDVEIESDDEKDENGSLSTLSSLQPKEVLPTQQSAILGIFPNSHRRRNKAKKSEKYTNRIADDANTSTPKSDTTVKTPVVIAQHEKNTPVDNNRSTTSPSPFGSCSSSFVLSKRVLSMCQALSLSDIPRIIVDARSPFVVKHANAAFYRLLGNICSDNILGEALLHKEQQCKSGPRSALHHHILNADRISLSPIVSDGASNGWVYMGPMDCNGKRGIVSHFLIQIEHPSSSSSLNTGDDHVRVVA